MGSGRISVSEMAVRRQEMLEAAFRLFSGRNIDAVTLDDIAAETGYTTRSLLRYFKSKDGLVLAAAVWAWENFFANNRKLRPKAGSTAAETYAFFLDLFLRMYREHGDILRFNQYFNIYIKSRRVDAEHMQPYMGMIDAIRERFHAVYEKGRVDGTLRTDIPEEKMFSATLHLMLAVVTRYAVGLAYDTGVDPEQELLEMRDMMLERYTNTK